jgi:hypothetical protein
MNENQEITIERNFPTVERVARRAIVMSAVVHRAFMEYYAKDLQNEPAIKEECHKAFTWLERLDVLDELEPQERAILETPLGELTARQTSDCSRQGEGLAVLAWALNQYTLPDYDELVIPKEVAKSIFFNKPEAKKLFTTPNLRTPEEILEYSEEIFALHWRLRDYQHQPRKINLKASAGMNGPAGSLNITGLRLIDGDLAIGDVEISQAPDVELRKCMSITQERHKAAKWLAGFAEKYSEVDTSTKL